MSPSVRRLLITLALMVGFTALYLNRLADVPFHPDESTNIHMSRDFETLFIQRNPQALYWQPGEPLTPETEFRLLDAPLTRHLIGLSWWLGGYTADDLSQAWLWGPTWEENAQAGRLPRPEVLWISRLPPALLGALSAVALFWLGYAVGGWGVGLLAALLLGLDPLLLLHARRAMAEGALVFFSVLAAWSGLRFTLACDRAEMFNGRLIAGAALTGLVCGLALASKQTLAVLTPVAMLASGAALWQRPWPRVRRLSALGITWLALGLSSLGMFWALNPILYPDPFTGVLAMLAKREQLVRDQTTVNDPAVVLATPSERLGAAIDLLYLQPPTAYEAPVYLEQVTPLVERYDAWPLHNLLPRPTVGAAILILSAIGVLNSAMRLRRDRATQFLWLWLAATLALIAFTIPLGWQRYFLPLLPIGHLFAALGLAAARIGSRPVSTV